MCLGSFTLHSPASVFSGVICLHVDDTMGTSGDSFESKLKELNKLVGFGSTKRQRFDHCARQYEEHVNGEITMSMKAHIPNMNEGSLTRERTKQLDDELPETENHEFQGINEGLQWVTKGVTLSLSIRCENASTTARTGYSARPAQSKRSH